MKITSLHEITVKYFEHPSSKDGSTIIINLPSMIEINNENIKLFISNCLGIEIFSTIGYTVISVRPV